MNEWYILFIYFFPCTCLCTGAITIYILIYSIPNNCSSFKHSLFHLYRASDGTDKVEMAHVAETQEELPVRSMSDSFSELIIPLSDVAARQKYLNPSMKGIRFGRILEDLDTFSGIKWWFLFYLTCVGISCTLPMQTHVGWAWWSFWICDQEYQQKKWFDFSTFLVSNEFKSKCKCMKKLKASYTVHQWIYPSFNFSVCKLQTYSGWQI